MNARIRCRIFGTILPVGAIMWSIGCQSGPEIPSGAEIENSAPSLQITIDATRITSTELFSTCGDGLHFDSTVIQSIAVPTGSCVLETATGGVIGFFTVTPAGIIDYDQSLDVGVFSGRGTSTLSVVPHQIAIDAIGLTKTSLAFFGATTLPSFDSQAVQHLSLASTNYFLETATGGVIGFFAVTPNGTVDYDPSLDGRVFSGRGTSTLTIISLE
jgi:hypothetical protein